MAKEEKNGVVIVTGYVRQSLQVLAQSPTDSPDFLLHQRIA